ncbi:MAG: hypothetical protein ND866_13380 [Pyrinomonadaceae bacterium]|nr:hypothetical protein [Pyrinomonadaceae bacterium]
MNLKLLLGLKRLADYKSESRRLSKQIARIIGQLAGSSLIFATVFIATPRVASMPQATAAAPSAPRNAAIVATTVTILKETSEIRELAILRPVKSGAQSRTEIERMIIRNLDEQTTPAEMHATELALKKLGLAPSEFQYRSFVVKLLTEQVAGYYDPKAQQFYLADWIELEGQKPVMAHELTHALQDQHFNLRRFENWPKGDSDAELAAHALIEGDATLAMTLYMAKNPIVALAFIRSLGGSNMASEQIKLAPRAIRESLIFPYEQGSEWATRVYKRGGWASVSQAYSKLPLSSEQILHPEKYFDYEVPVKIGLPDFRTALGSGWKRIDYDVNGEWSFYLILDQFLNASAESRRAAAGWAGDRYALYEGSKPGEVFIVQLTAWDTQVDAREFFDAYAKRTWRRYPNAKATEITSDVDTKAVNGPTQSPVKERHEWQTDEGRVVVELQGPRVLIMEGIPGHADIKALSRASWQ